jgi:hypothetical protein
VGEGVGSCVGAGDGGDVGRGVGVCVGEGVGCDVGNGVGSCIGERVGVEVGNWVEGGSEGVEVGEQVTDAKGTSQHGVPSMLPVVIRVVGVTPGGISPQREF